MALVLTAEHQNSTIACTCRSALEKRPRKRPIASHLLEHTWVVKHIAAAMGKPSRSATLDRLLEPIPIYVLPDAPAQGAAASTLSPVAEDAPALTASASVARVKFDTSITSVSERAAVSSGTAASQQDALQALRAEFGGNVRAATPGRNLGHSLSKGSFSFSVPTSQYANVAVQQLSAEEKGETGAAIGMKARLQLYMERQRM